RAARRSAWPSRCSAPACSSSFPGDTCVPRASGRLPRPCSLPTPRLTDIERVRLPHSRGRASLHASDRMRVRHIGQGAEIMNKYVSRGLWTVLATGGLMALGVGVAHADTGTSGEDGIASGTEGILGI